MAASQHEMSDLKSPAEEASFGHAFQLSRQIRSLGSSSAESSVDLTLPFEVQKKEESLYGDHVDQLRACNFIAIVTLQQEAQLEARREAAADFEVTGHANSKNSKEKRTPLERVG